MKPGDKVVVICKLGLQPQEQENDGEYLGKSQDLFPSLGFGPEVFAVKTRGKPDTVHVTRDKVARLDQRIESDEQLAEWGKANIFKLQQLLDPALAELFPGVQPITVNCPDEGGFEDYNIELADGELVISPTYHRHRCIGRIVEDAGWEIARIKYHPQTRHEPADQEHCPLSSHRNEAYAAREAVKVLFEVLAERYWEHEGEKALAEEYASLGDLD